MVSMCTKSVFFKYDCKKQLFQQWVVCRLTIQNIRWLGAPINVLWTWSKTTKCLQIFFLFKGFISGVSATKSLEKIQGRLVKNRFIVKAKNHIFPFKQHGNLLLQLNCQILKL